MARIRWAGFEFTAEPIEQQSDGIWRMKATHHSARFSPGTIILVRQNEIVEMAAAETPDGPSTAATLEADMAKERETLPGVRALLAKAAPL